MEFGPAAMERADPCYARILLSITKLLDQLWSLAVARAAGRAAERQGAPGWPDLASTGSIWLLWASSSSDLGAQQRAGWLDLAASARPGRPATPGWLDLAANECPNDCPIDTISEKKNNFLIDDTASMLPASCALDRSFMPQM